MLKQVRYGKRSSSLQEEIISGTVEVDEIDIKILSWLIRDARTRLKDIAKDCGISSVSALNRIKRLKTLEVITGATIWPRLDSLDLPITATVGIDLDTSENEISKLIGERMNLAEPSAALGKYDLLAFVIANNVTELDKIAYEARKCSGVRAVTVNIWSGKPHLIFENINLQPKGTGTVDIGFGEPYLIFENINLQPKKPNRMDKLDYLILTELLKDAQMSFVTIAKKFGTSSFTIRKRYERMKKEGIVNKCTVTIDLSKLGYQGKVFFMISISQQRDKSRTILALKKIRNIFTITEILGSFDILAIAPVTDVNSIRTMVNKIKELSDVQKVEITCISNSIFPLPSLGEVLSRKSYKLATALN